MKLQFNDKVYDILKWLCLIALPALSVLRQVKTEQLNTLGVQPLRQHPDDGVLFVRQIAVYGEIYGVARCAPHNRGDRTQTEL